MFSTAFSELFSINQNDNANLYGATLIFVTLFEYELKERIRNYYTRTLLIELEKEIANGLILNSGIEKDLYNKLRYMNNLVDIDNTKYEYDITKAIGYLAYELFNKYLPFTTDKEFNKKLFGIHAKPLTLNELIIHPKFISIVDPNFWEIINIMFKPAMMNLRNNITHGNRKYENHHHIYVTALIYGLYFIVVEELFYK